MRVTIYSTTTCPYCKNVSFTEKLVDQDDLVRNEMATESGGFLGVPFTVVTKDDNTKETIIGFDKGKIDSII